MQSSADARRWIAGLEQAERERTGIKGLRVGFNKVFGYYLQVSHAYKGEVPAQYIRRQTLTDGERYITPELKEYENLVLHAQERIAELERRLFAGVQREIAGSATRLLATAGALARLDVLAGFAEVAVRRGYVRPLLDEDETLEIEAGPPPGRGSGAGRGHRPAGPAGGLRPQRLPPGHLGRADRPHHRPQHGREEHLPALRGPDRPPGPGGELRPRGAARIGLVDRIFTRVGAQDDLAAGQSTFMVEMVETASILRHATRKSLVILDEIGRGTSTYDGVAIAQAVVEHLHGPQGGPRTLFATHYHELAALQGALPRVRNYRVDVLEEGDRVVFLHRVVPGQAGRSYGIHVARLAGVPRAVTRRAEEVLAGLEAVRGDFGQPGAPRPASRPDSPPPTPVAPGPALTNGHPAVAVGEGRGTRKGRGQPGAQRETAPPPR